MTDATIICFKLILLVFPRFKFFVDEIYGNSCVALTEVELVDNSITLAHITTILVAAACCV